MNRLLVSTGFLPAVLGIVINPVAAQTKEEQLRWDRAQVRFHVETARYDEEREIYHQARARDGNADITPEKDDTAVPTSNAEDDATEDPQPESESLYSAEYLAIFNEEVEEELVYEQPAPQAVAYEEEADRCKKRNVLGSALTGAAAGAVAGNSVGDGEGDSTAAAIGLFLGFIVGALSAKKRSGC